MRTGAKRSPDADNAATAAKMCGRSHVACVGTDDASFCDEGSTKRRRRPRETQCLQPAAPLEERGLKRKPRRPMPPLPKQPPRRSAASNEQTAIAKRSDTSPNALSNQPAPLTLSRRKNDDFAGLVQCRVMPQHHFAPIKTRDRTIPSTDRKTSSPTSSRLSIP